MSEFQEILRGKAEKMNIGLIPEQLEQFDLYQRLLLEWNEKMNLTAIKEPEQVAVKHFVDSLLLLKALEVPQGAMVADIGTGAGFPSVPAAIVRSDLKLTLVDSLNKRVNFLTELCRELGIPATAVHGRAEELGRQPKYREQYDLVTARAVAQLRELSEYCLPFVKSGGAFAGLKGYEIEEELETAKPAIRQLGGKTEAVKKFVLPDESRRAIVIVRKISQTPSKYPRTAAKMAKTPIL